MPADKIAALCVMHLMKHLFSQFILDSKASGSAAEASLMGKQADESLKTREIKIPAAQLFRELGRLFD